MKKILAITVLGLSMVFGFSTFALAANSNGTPVSEVTSGTTPAATQPTDFPGTYGMPTPANSAEATLKSGDVSTDNNNANNANKTGINSNQAGVAGDVIKSDNMNTLSGAAETQKTHGSYQNNTNSCASCHQTHTSESKPLLFKDGVYNTCTACHDGTLGFYNVFDPSSAGTFGGTKDGNASVHLANGAMNISAAPGGNHSATGETGPWVQEFNCASCHSPHGSYSDRLLNYNPNGMGTTKWTDGGKAIKFETVAPFGDLTLNTGTTPTYSLPASYKVTAKIAGVDELVYPEYLSVLGTAADFNITETGVNGTDPAIVVFKYTEGREGAAGTYARTNDPWLYYYNNRDTYKPYWVRFYKQAAVDVSTNGKFYNKDGVLVENYSDYNYDANKVKGSVEVATNMVDTNDDTKADLTDGIKINYAKGYAVGSLLNGVVKADVSQAYVVQFDKVQINKFGTLPIYTVSETALKAGNLAATGTMRGTTPDWVADQAYVKGALVFDSGKIYKAKNNITSATKPGDDTTNWSDTKATTGKGVALSNFCSACHTDYLASSEHKSGTFGSAYRHTTTTDSYNCQRCHFAHGTDVTVMKDGTEKTPQEIVDASGGTITLAQAKEYMLDKNPSSALKRYTNMSVCYTCHTSSHNEQFVNTKDWQENANHLNGLQDNFIPTADTTKTVGTEKSPF